MANELNNACIFTLGSYKAVYDVECVDEEQKIWKGKPLPLPVKRAKGPPSLVDAPANSWLFFSRMYHDTNDWDMYYPEIEIKDPKIAGVPFLLIPKEKHLFGYEPPTTIALPRSMRRRG